MAKKSLPDPILDAKSDLIAHFADFTNLRNIDRATLMSVLEDVFRAMLRKKYGSDENFNIIVNVERGDIQVQRIRTIVNDFEVDDEHDQISLSEALLMDPENEVGDQVADIVGFKEFGLRQILSAKQLLAQRIKELEKQAIFEHYKSLEGEIIVGEIYQIFKKEMIVFHEGVELILPKEETIPKDSLKKGSAVRAIVLETTNKNGNVRVILSRTSPLFLQRLLEREVPEIADGLISVRNIVREPGERAKVSVESYDERIDPAGACIGVRGSRIGAVSRELQNESIDVVNYSPNISVYLMRSLGNITLLSIKVNEVKRHASIKVSTEQISFAIGKGGANARLASKLTGYEIDLFREDEYDDIDLEEFITGDNAIDAKVVAVFIEAGLKSAVDILKTPIDEIAVKTQLDIDTIENVLEVIRKEIEED